MATVALRDLTKVYPERKGGGVAVVRGINLEVRDGEFMVLVGPSGCGKSTTLRLIAGLEEVSGGAIEIEGREVNDVPPKDRDIAMVFQNYALYPHLSVYENLAFGLRLRKVPVAEIDTRVRACSALLGLDGYLERKPRALSGGQRQRVAVGRAIVRQPKVFLFDEPLSNLDATMRATTRAELIRLHRRLAATMIYVTHDQVEAMTMGDRICVMRDGRIMQVATPLELYQRPANRFVAGFIGSPPMNFFAGVLQGEAVALVFQADDGFAVPVLSSAARQVGRRVWFGVRPEHVVLAHNSASAQGEGTIEMIEPMGAETFLHARIGGTMMVLRVASDHGGRCGERMAVRFPAERAHLFDSETDETLG